MVQILINNKGGSFCGLALSIIRNQRQLSTAVQGSFSHSVGTLDTRVGANKLTPDLGVISTYILVIDHAELPLDKVSTVVSQNLQ